MKELFDFGEALARLRDGKRVCREGWNGKDMFIYLTLGSEVATSDLKGNAGIFLATAPSPIFINGHIDMKAADGSIVVGWLASQTDMLACDWKEYAE